MHEWTTPLAWTLLHTLWQAAAVAAVVWLVLRVTPARRAGLRHAVATAAVFVVLGGAIATHAVVVAPGRTASPEPAILKTAAVARESADRRSVEAEPATVRGSAPAAAGAPAAGVSWLPLLSGLWLVGVAVSLGRMLLGLRTARRLARATTPAPAWLQDRCDRLAERMNLARRVLVRVADAHASPCVVGLLQPLVLLPAPVVAGDSNALRVILAHELAHARGLHPLLSLCVGVAESLLFFNPAVRWLAAQAALEREAFCDAAAAEALGGDGAAVAATLGRAAETRWAPALPAAAGFLGRGPSPLASRMRRLLTPAEAPGLASPRWLLPLAAAAVLAALALHRVSGLVAEELMSGDAFVAQAAEVAEAAPPSYPHDAEPVSLSGTVTAEGGLPAGSRVMLRISVQSGIRGETTSISARVGNDGIARFEQPPPRDTMPGTTTVVAHADGFARTVLPSFETEPGEEVTGIEVVLTPGFSSTIELVDARGRPIEGARPQAFAQLGSSGHGMGDLGRTDADGRLTVPHLSAMEHALHWEVPGFARDRTAWFPEPDGVERVVLADAVPVRGRVVDGGGDPIAGARVARVVGFGGGGTDDPRDPSDGDPPPAVTDADGRFRLDHAPAGSRGTVWAAADGFAPAVVWGVPAGEGAGAEIRLDPAYAVEVAWAGPLEELAEDRDGRRVVSWQQSLEVEPNHTYRALPVRVPVVPVDRDDGVTATARIDGPHLLRAPLTVTAGGVTREVGRPWEARVVRLDPGAAEPAAEATRTVRLRLVSPPGWPVPDGGTLRVLGLDPDARAYRGPGNVPVMDGVVEFEAPSGITRHGAEGGAVVMWEGLTSPGYRVDKAREVVVPPGEGVHEIDVPAIPAGAVRGRVVDEAGAPFADARLSLDVLERPTGADAKPQHVDPNLFNNVRADADGGFAIPGVPLGGRYRVQADAVDRETRVLGEAFEPTRSSPFAVSDLVLPAGTDVAVRVLGPGGGPVAGATAYYSWSDPEGGGHGGVDRTTDADGRVVLPGVNLALPGEHRVRVDAVPASAPHPDGLQAAEAELPGAGGPVEVRLEAGLRLFGRVVDDASGEPVAHRRVTAMAGFADDAATTRVEGVTDADGRFDLAGLSDTAYRLDLENAYPEGTTVLDHGDGTFGYRYPSGWPAGNLRPGTGEPVEVRVVLQRD